MATEINFPSSSLIEEVVLLSLSQSEIDLLLYLRSKSNNVIFKNLISEDPFTELAATCIEFITLRFCLSTDIVSLKNGHQYLYSTCLNLIQNISKIVNSFN